MMNENRPWYRQLTGYHWFVLSVCTAGWLFDCLDQQLFLLARQPAVAELSRSAETDAAVAEWGGYATSIMLIGWAAGGIIFGIMGDKIGRARTMVFTILVYSVFTGLCGLSYTIYDFLILRFITGLGVGGQFAVGVALAAETMPDKARAPALGFLQAVSALGNVTAAVVSIVLSSMRHAGIIEQTPWRWMFAVGVIPAFLAFVVFRYLEEPEKWKHSVDSEGKKVKAGSFSELFGTPRWRKNVIVGMILATAGVVGLWGIGFFSIDLNRSVFRHAMEDRFRGEGSAVDDQMMVRILLRSPDLRMKELIHRNIQPQDLLSLTASDQDPRQITACVVSLAGRAELAKGEPLTTDTVLAALAKERERQKEEPLSGEERSRIQAYLEGGITAAETEFSEIVDRLVERKRKINYNVGWWGGITSLLFNVGAFFGMYSFSLVTQRIGRRPTFAIFFTFAYFTTVIAFVFMDRPSEVFWMVPLMGFFQLSVFGGYAIYFPELFPTRLRSTGVSFCYNIGRVVAALGPMALGLLTSRVFVGFDEPMRPAGVAMCSIFLIGIVILRFAPETKDQPLPE